MIDDTFEQAVRAELHQQAERVTVPPPDPYVFAGARPEAANGGESRLFRRLPLAVATGVIAVLLAWAGTYLSVGGTVTNDPAVGGADPAPALRFRCYRGGPETDVALDLDGEIPIGFVESSPGVESGFATTMALVNAATCAPVTDDEGVVYEVTTADAEIATVAATGPSRGVPWNRPGVWFDLTLRASGQTTAYVRAVDRDSGDVLAEAAVPVLARQR